MINLESTASVVPVGSDGSDGSGGSGPVLEQRRPFLSVRRVLVCYVITLIALACGTPLLILGWVKSDRCTAPGFGCLGYFFYGTLGAALVAVVVLLALAIGFRAGVVFWLTALAAVVLPGLISSNNQLAVAAFILAPGLAAWVAHPPRRRTRLTSTAVRRWTHRSAVLVVLLVGVPLLIGLLRG